MCLLVRVLRGGAVFNGEYTEKGYKYFDSEDEAIKGLVNSASQDEKMDISKQKYHLSITPYIGYRMNEQSDIYLTGGVKMVATKYVDFKNKRTFHPVLGAGARYTFSNNVFIKFESTYIFKRKTKILGEDTIEDGETTHKIKGKVTVAHGEYVMKLGVGCKF